MKVETPHDKIFKETMGRINVTEDFLENYFPDSIKNTIDLNTLEFEKGNIIDEALKESLEEGSEFAMTLVESFREEGLVEGLVKGIEEGIRQEKINITIKLLTKKFGVLPQETKNKIEQSDKVILEKITDGIFDFESLDDVKKYLE